MSNSSFIQTNVERAASHKASRLLFLLMLLFVLTGQGTLGTKRAALAEVPAPGTSETDLAQQARELLNLSARQNFEDHALGLRTAQQALTIYQSLGNDVGTARAYAQIGRCAMAQSDLALATQSYENELQIWRNQGKPSQQAESLIMLGFVEYRKGEWQAAISFFVQAQRLIDENQEPLKMGQIASGMADIFNETGLPEEGLVQYQRALDYFRRTPDPRDDVSSIAGLGYTYYLLGRYPEALAQSQQALASVDPNGIDAAQFREYIGRVHRATGDYDAALPHLQFALDFYEKAKNPLEAGQVRALMGEIYQHQGHISLARQYYQKALSTFVAISDKLNQGATYYMLGRLEMKQGDFNSAETYLQQSITVTEDVRRQPTSSDLTTAFSATVHERYESYIECLMHKHQTQPDRGFAEQAFEISELGRARSLAELLSATQSKLPGSVDAQLAAKEKSLRQTLRVKEGYKVRLLSSEPKKEQLNALESELTELNREYALVNEAIHARYPAYEQLTRPSAWNLRQIREQVLKDDQTVLLEYSLGEERSYLWCVSHSEFSTYELPGRDEIEKRALRFHELLSGNRQMVGDVTEQHEQLASEAELQTEAATMGRLLLGSVAERIGSKRLLIVADGALQYVPFQGMVLPGAAGETAKPLLMDHEVINEPSASTLGLVINEAASRKQAAGTVAVLADPVFTADDPRLRSPASSVQAEPNSASTRALTRALRDIHESNEGSKIPRLLATREEADAIMAVLPWRTGLKALDFEANRATASANELSQYRIVHFATHALVDSKDPASSGILLSLFDRDGKSLDGFLGLTDIHNLKLPVDLVVLSACQTGLGKNVKGEGLVGLTRGFMYAGASGVVASLWKVNDEATAELMKHFYEGMFTRGLTPAAALREAQLAMRQQKRWQSPYYWAGFVIQGNYANREQGAYFITQKAKLGLLIALSAAALLAFVLRMRTMLKLNTSK